MLLFPRAIRITLLNPVLLAACTFAATVLDTPFEQRFRDPFVQGTALENDVRSIAVSADSSVWVATAAGVRRVADGAFVVPEGASQFGEAFQIQGAADGAVWFGTARGLCVARNNIVERIVGLEGPVTAVCTDEGRILVGCPNGVFEYSQGEWTQLKGAWATSIRSIAVSHGDICVGTDIGLYLYDGHSTNRFAAKGEITSSSIRFVRAVPGRDTRRTVPTSLWVGTNAGYDVFEASPGGWTRSLWLDATGLHQADSKETVPGVAVLPESEVRGFGWRRDDAGFAKEMVIATPVGVVIGSLSLRPVRWKLLHSQRWLASDDVRGIAIGTDGTIWAATGAGVSAIRSKRMRLEEKAEHFESMVRARHVRPPGLVEKCVLARPGDLASWQPTDTDNDGEYTGTYLVAESYRWGVTEDPQAKQNAQDAFRALEFLQTVTGTKGFIARTVIPADWTSMSDPNRSITAAERAKMLASDPRERFVERRWRLSDDLKWLWKGDTSSDEVIGHFYAWSVYFDLVAEGEERTRVADLARRVMDAIISDGYVFRDLDGEATRWGVWSPEKLNDDPNWRPERGVNSVEVLSFLTSTLHMTGDEKYDVEIDRLLWEYDYAKNLQDPRPSDVGSYTHIDDELLPMAYRALMTYETDPDRRALYEKSMRAWFGTVRAEASPYYNFEFGSLVKETGKPILHSECIELLRDVPLDMINWTVDNRGRRDVRLVRYPVGDDVQTDRLLSPSERAVFKWDSNPYHAVGGDGGRSENCPAFWLWPYWLGRYHGLISDGVAIEGSE